MTETELSLAELYPRFEILAFPTENLCLQNCVFVAWITNGGTMIDPCLHSQKSSLFRHTGFAYLYCLHANLRQRDFQIQTILRNEECIGITPTDLLTARRVLVVHYSSAVPNKMSIFPKFKSLR